jgi:hypothetical protein
MDDERATHLERWRQRVSLSRNRSIPEHLDDEVTAFFSPHAAGKGFMFIVVFGKRRRRASE